MSANGAGGSRGRGAGGPRRVALRPRVDGGPRPAFRSEAPEDLRISKLIRSLGGEIDETSISFLCERLHAAILQPENSRYIRRAHVSLASSLLSLATGAPSRLAQSEAAPAIARLGLAMGEEFPRHLDWIAAEYDAQRSELAKRTLVLSLLHLFRLDNEQQTLQPHANSTVKQLQIVVETTDSPEIFRAAVEALVVLADTYPDSFSEYFIDTVDILIGWHMDASQDLQVKEFALKTLEKFQRHWQNEPVFSVNLLGQFTDDMVAYGENLSKAPSEITSSNDNLFDDPEKCLQSVISFMNVFNTVLKSLGDTFTMDGAKFTSRTFLSESFGKILKTFSNGLAAEFNPNLIDAGNESIYLLLDKLHGNISTDSTALYNIIETQLEISENMSGQNIVCLLDAIRKIIKEISSNLSSQFIKTVIGPDSNLLRLKNSPNKMIQERVVGVYQNLLNLKNVALLQEVYKYILEDIETAYKTLLPDADISLQNEETSNSSIYTTAEAEFIVLFNLQCLADLANASNSIIGMWALRPSILELLAVKLIPYDANLSLRYPSVQYSIIYLLYSHCKRNSHFIASSDLVSYGQRRTNMCELLSLSNLNLGDAAAKSPTCGHFAIILTLLSKLFKTVLPADTLIVLLNWTGDIFNQLIKSYSAVFCSKIIVDIILDCINVGFCSNKRIIKEVVQNLNILVTDRNVRWNTVIMKRIGELCMIHIDNINADITNYFLTLVAYVPWDILLNFIKTSHAKAEKYKSSTLISLNITNIKSAQKEHLMKDTYGQISAGDFKLFMNYLLFVNNSSEGWLKELFLNCWPTRGFGGDASHLNFFRRCALNFGSVLSMWATWEAAQLCTMSKLRTPLGKPQETFTSIESAIKQIARELTSNDNSIVNQKVSERSLSKFKRSRVLIEFFDCLEKSMQNAIDGCAVVLLPMDKPVRTFFHTNCMTCQEWVSRVRPAAILVSLHVGHAAAAARHCQALIYNPSLTASPALTTDLLAHCISLTRAYIMLKQPEALLGLFGWVRQVFNKKLFWLKSATDQAAMRYEIAINNYKTLLKNDHNDNAEGSEEHTSGLHDCEKKFIYEQVIECYKRLQFWDELICWKENQLLAIPSDSTYFAMENFDEITCYNKFQEDEIIYLEELSDWNLMTFDTDTDRGNIIKMFDKTESSLKNVALKIVYDPNAFDDAIDTIEQCIKFLQSSIHELSRNQPSDLLTDVHILHYAANGLKNVIVDRKTQINPFFTSPEKISLKNLDPFVLNKITWWFDYFLKVTNMEMDVSFIDSMRLDLVKSCRKLGNHKLAHRELLKYFNYYDHFQAFPGKSVKSLEDVSNFFMRSMNTFEINMCSPNNIIAIMETAKLLYADDSSKEMAMNLCASASLGVSQTLAMGDYSYEFREKGTRMLLTLSKWVQNENDKLLTNNLNSPLTKLVIALPEIGLVNNNISAHVIPISDSAVGKLLQFSVNQCPTFAKAWFTFGSWCFRWGKKMVEYSSNSGSQLLENDKVQIKTAMGQCSTEEYETVCEILSKTRVIYDDEDIDWSEINTSDMIENQLRSVPCLKNAFPMNLIMLVDIWRQAQKRVFSYHELSADAYFKFLDLSSGSEYINHNGECAIVTATLRLLRLIVKHAMELQNVLEKGLANTPTQPWKVIIPQLFSRLNHPENYVRRRVSELLCRLAEDAPHLITFPAVVGAVDNKKNKLTDFSKSALLNSEEHDIETIDNNTEVEETNDYLNSCFMDMVDTLSKQAPTTILQVRLFVKELRRINLLWDELWLRTLAQHHSAITKRLVQLNSEIIKVNNNPNLQHEDKEKLINEKQRIFMKPILFILEQLAEVTSATPETRYEQMFQEKFQPSINEMLNKLRHPIQPDKPLEFWQPIKQLQTKLQQKSNKRSPYMLKMSEISPILANMKDTVISMPGVQTSNNQRITIMSINNTVAILPSKTKPKKLIFHGSDGKIYTYLFKGLEDLHLDERIMQFLSITNIMMAQDKEDNNNQTYRARHYSVIPLGPRSGLISWVDNLTPLFALYKRWQQRDAVSSNKNATNKSTVVLRPSELFYNKLLPLLNAAGVNTENRKEWPISILKQVLVELMAETPNDLLAKELWSSSITPGQWWHTVRRYSFSVAVMSTIGYIIGLGDRHLDNVLIDLSTGEVVHIDYNVCFEDGKTLRVPEKVPFRMTPNLERCLGATGVEGIFRMACEHVLKTMKRGRKTLLTLLEAFVYDPLVEWSGETGGAGATAGVPLNLPGRSSAIQSAAIERRCGLDLLAVRIVEIRHNWTENRDEIQKQLFLLRQHAHTWNEQNQALLTAESQLQQCHCQLALIKEVEALGADCVDHPLYAAAQRYSAYKQMKDALEESAKNLLDLRDDCAVKIENFTRALEVVKGSQLSQWFQEMNFPIDHDRHLVFDIIREFLLNAGQSSMISQCEQSETEFGQCAKQQIHLIKNCLELITQFAAIAQYFPLNFLEKHRLVLSHKWTSLLLETDLPNVCDEIINQIHTFRSPENLDNAGIQQAIAFSYQLQSTVNDQSMKLNKICERIKSEGGVDAGRRCDKNYSDARNAISNFISQGTNAEKAMECVIINSLCNLNHRFLMLENSALSAGDCLVDFISRDGDWFLDDMNVISSLITELISIIPMNQDNSSMIVSHCLNSSKLIISSLKNTINTFQTAIVPEAIKKIQTEEPSVILMINDLNSMIINTPCSLSELLTQLNVHLRCVIRETEAPASNTHVLINELKLRYNNLIETTAESGSNSAGCLLLRDCNLLFSQLENQSTSIVDSLISSNFPQSWKKIDQLIDSYNLSASLYNKQVRSILDDMFLIKRIQALSEFFKLCVQMSCSFKGIGHVIVFDDETFTKPIKRYVSDYVSRYFLGVQSQCLSISICYLLQRFGLNIDKEIEQRHIGVSWKVHLNDLCEMLSTTSIKSGLFTTSLMQQANSLVNNLEIAFKKREALLLLKDNAQLLGNCITRLKHQIAAHTWLRGEARGSSNSPNLSTELRRAAHQITLQNPRLTAALEKHRSLVASAEQRLKWAAGANPALNEKMAAFECAVKIREDRLNVECSLAAKVGATCAALGGLYMDANNGNGVWANGRDLTSLAARRQSALELVARTPAAPTPLHESLLQLSPPVNNIDMQWVNKMSILLSEKIILLQKNIVEIKTSLTASDGDLKKLSAVLNTLKTTHDNLISDARSQLKIISKSQENIGVRAMEYLSKQKSYTTDLADIIDNLNSLNISEKNNIRNELIGRLDSETKTIYDDFLEFEMMLRDADNETNKRRGTLVRQMAGVWNSPVKQTTAPKGRGQQVNAYAVSVWKRVRLKLEGRDPDPARKYSNQEQVDYIIKEAMSLDNLCLLYEGWTPWV